MFKCLYNIVDLVKMLNFKLLCYYIIERPLSVGNQLDFWRVWDWGSAFRGYKFLYYDWM